MHSTALRAPLLCSCRYSNFLEILITCNQPQSAGMTIVENGKLRRNINQSGAHLSQHAISFVPDSALCWRYCNSSIQLTTHIFAGVSRSPLSPIHTRLLLDALSAYRSTFTKSMWNWHMNLSSLSCTRSHTYASMCERMCRVAYDNFHTTPMVYIKMEKIWIVINLRSPDFIMSFRWIKLLH